MKIEFDTPISVPCVDSWMHFDIDYNQLHPDDRVEIATKATKHMCNQEITVKKNLTSVNQFNKSSKVATRSNNFWMYGQLLRKVLSAETIQKLHKKVTRKIDADAVRERANFDPNAANQVILTNSLLGD